MSPERSPAVRACAGFASCLLAACGCIKAEMALVLEPDASATLTLTYSLPEETIERAAAMRKLRAALLAAADQEPAPTPQQAFEQWFFDPAEENLRALVKPYEPLGVSIEAIRIRPRAAGRDVTAKIRFARLADLARADFFPRSGFSLARRTDGSFRLFRPAYAPPGRKIPPIADQAELRELTPLLQGFDLTVLLRVPGQVVSSNGMISEPRTALWAFEFDRDPAALARLQNNPFEVVFRADAALPEITLPAPRIAGPFTAASAP